MAHLWHGDRKYWPRQRGFDYQYGPVLGEIDYFTHEAHGVSDWYRDDEMVKEDGHATTLLGNDAVRLIEGHDPETPLFRYLTFTAPHAPYQAPQGYVDRHEHVADPDRRAYAAMISAMDDEVGRVMAALDKRGMRENTLVVFQSDNGGPRSAQFAGEVDMSKSTIPADNGRFRDGKGTLYEGGTRVAALANWPGHIKRGAVVEQPIHIVDMYPTLASLAGGSLGRNKPLDGIDVWQTISEGHASPRQEVVHNIGPFLAAVREKQWKLVWQTTLPSRIELFNMAQDPSEKSNVAERNTEKVTRPQQRIGALAREAVPPLLLQEAFGVTKHVLFGSVSTPQEVEDLEMQP